MTEIILAILLLLSTWEITRLSKSRREWAVNAYVRGYADRCIGRETRTKREIIDHCLDEKERSK